MGGVDHHGSDLRAG